MKLTIEVKDTFLCTKTYKMTEGEKAYIKGNLYICEVENYLTDESLDTHHRMNGETDFFEYFKYLEDGLTYMIEKEAHKNRNNLNK